METATMDNPSPENGPPGADFPLGFLDFTTTTSDETATVTLLLPSGFSVNIYWKYGPTPVEPNAHWYEFVFDGTTGAEIRDDRIVLHFVDGQRGDDDLSGNGRISDPGGPAFVAPTVAPAAMEMSSLGASLLSVEDTFVGVAIVNPNEIPNEVSLTLMDASGNEISRIDLNESLAARGQVAVLTHEVLDPPSDPAGVIVRGHEGPVQGFFLIGDNAQTKLDGVAGEFQFSNRLYFPVVRQGNDHTTLLFVLNAGTETATVVSSLFDPLGELLQESSQSVDRNGFIIGNIQDLFGAILEEGYVSIESAVPVMGFEFLEGEEYFYALGAQVPRAVKRLLAPHFFVDSQLGSTTIRLLNVDPALAVAKKWGFEKSTVTIKARAFDDAAIQLGETDLELDADTLFVADVAELFELDSLGAGTITGYLDLELEDHPEGFEVLGSVTFTVGESRAVLPMTSGGRTSSSFLQVAQSIEARFFTGLAILNAGSETALVTVTAFGEDGTQTGQTQLDIGGGNRVVGLLDEEAFFGPQFNQVKGHLRISSDVPVVSFALFGDSDSKVLAAIEGQSAPQ